MSEKLKEASVEEFEQKLKSAIEELIAIKDKCDKMENHVSSLTDDFIRTLSNEIKDKIEEASKKGVEIILGERIYTFRTKNYDEAETSWSLFKELCLKTGEKFILLLLSGESEKLETYLHYNLSSIPDKSATINLLKDILGDLKKIIKANDDNDELN